MLHSNCNIQNEWYSFLGPEQFSIHLSGQKKNRWGYQCQNDKVNSLRSEIEFKRRRSREGHEQTYGIWQFWQLQQPYFSHVFRAPQRQRKAMTSHWVLVHVRTTWVTYHKPIENHLNTGSSLTHYLLLVVTFSQHKWPTLGKSQIVLGVFCCCFWWIVRTSVHFKVKYYRHSVATTAKRGLLH